LNEKINKLEKIENLIYETYMNKNIVSHTSDQNIIVGMNSSLLYSSFKNSVFIEDPTQGIKKITDKFNFLPLTEKSLDILKDIFTNSTTISSDLITNDLLICLPKIQSGCRIYQTSKDGPSAKIFHEMCDNKGPTLIVIKLEDGHVFGGYNPISWIGEYMYNDCEDAFLFSITDGKYRKPIRCPVKKSLKKFAIKQNDVDYSPGFGETDNADLFIAFKNLKNSYSNLSNVYKCPRGFNGKEFLAGRPNDWKIVDVEVFAIEVMNDVEYYNKIKN
jgi:hypothetical protein